MLDKLEWRPLQQRRKELKCALFHIATHVAKGANFTLIAGTMSDMYSSTGGALKLKTTKDSKKKSKKEKKRKEKERENSESEEDEEVRSKRPSKRKTPAQIAFENHKRKKQDKDLLKKAEKTHKERILELNQHLDSLSEHYDIPKVSWTK